MQIPRTEADLLQLIQDQVEESLSLDYKRGEALTRPSGDLTKEVTKDVSAFANSAGGIIIYGIAEGSGTTKYLPESLAPIDRNLFSKERLEHLIANIQPKISGIEIVPVPLSTGANDAAYVVVIPASTTAHQSTDKRYYRRYNFQATMMEDYEIRDVMNRNRFAVISLEVLLRLKYSKPNSGLYGSSLLGGGRNDLQPNCWWMFAAKNIGGAVGNYLEGTVEIPTWVLHDYKKEQNSRRTLQLSNHLQTRNGPMAKPSDPEYKPVLPGCSLHLDSEMASSEALLIHERPFAINWKFFCDAAPSQEGTIYPRDIIVEANAAFEKALSQQSMDFASLGFKSVTRI